MGILGFQLPMWPAAIVIVLLTVAIAAGAVHWAIVARISGLRAGSGPADRLLPFGLGDWHIGVLRRSWYPDEAVSLRRWVVLTYAVGMGALIVAAGLLIIWVIL